ncbi:hypothetical protein ABC382_00880 [Lysinibacillus sp. 1P01SD]|uniref:hypothetical protein n=1 Tax=Lysinibacillus sp. 1P01SD TaxID=3132285 RepID=UPI0039A399D9
MISNDVSKHFKFNYYDARVGQEILQFEGTPKAILFFAEKCEKLTDYAYWFFLSTCWVSYTGFSDLELWKELFSSERPKRKECIMKPSEVKAYNSLPYFVTIYRAHRENEKDWIAYTLDKNIAIRFARERNVSKVSAYKIKKQHILALFTRRGEEEVIVLNKENVELIETLEI